MSQPPALADWSTPQPFVLPELGPGVEGELLTQLEAALRRIAADPAVKALSTTRPAPSVLDCLLIRQDAAHSGSSRRLNGWLSGRPWAMENPASPIQPTGPANTRAVAIAPLTTTSVAFLFYCSSLF